MFCDFAGQPFFHKTHGLFFSATSTIFLLVVDLNEDEDKIRRSSHYWASFVKCSVFLDAKAYVVVIGSKRDQLSCPILIEAEAKLKHLVRYLQATFGQWFEFVDDVFLLNCREKSSKQLKSFQRTLGEVKCRALKVLTNLRVSFNSLVQLHLPNVFRRLKMFQLLSRLQKQSYYRFCEIPNLPARHRQFFRKQ